MVKNQPANAGDCDLIPGSRRSPGEGNGSPLQYSCLENSMDRGAWQATVHGVAKSRTQLSETATILWISGLSRGRDDMSPFSLRISLSDENSYMPQHSVISAVNKSKLCRLNLTLGGGGSHSIACGILVPWPEIEPMPSAVKAWSPNHWTPREVPIKAYFYFSPLWMWGWKVCWEASSLRKRKQNLSKYLKTQKLSFSRSRVGGQAMSVQHFMN